MNIIDFEEYIDESILDRGYDYYIDKHIIEINNKGDNEYCFTVEGSECYEVIVKLDSNNEILYSHCDCFYDYGPICKHQVAVYFELDDILHSKNYGQEIKDKILKQPKIEEVLNNFSKEELIDIIVDITNNNDNLTSSIIFRYSKGDDQQETYTCKKYIDSIVKKYIGREGFITFRETYGFVIDMEELLKKARSIYIDRNNYNLALDIVFLVLYEAIESFQYADDSNGDIGGLVLATIELVGEIINNSKELKDSERKRIFYRLLEKIYTSVFDDWEEYRIDLISVCVEFSDIEECRNNLKDNIEQMIDCNMNDDYKKYYSEKLLLILFQLIEEYETQGEAEVFVKENLQFSSFREKLINKYIKEEKHEKALELTIEGEKKDEKHYGLVLKWKKIRYEIYKKTSIVDEQKELASELFFNGNYEYYNELEELYKQDKEIFYNKTKKKLKDSTRWNLREMYLRLIVDKKDLLEIFEFVSENPSYIEEYADMLLENYTEQVIKIYKKNIKLQAESSSNRKQYKGICRKLRKYKEIAGKKKFETIVNELSITYKRRPAFLDELSKIS